MKKILIALIFIVCLPFVGTLFVTPDRSGWQRIENDTSVTNERFRILVSEEAGMFAYRPEELTVLLMYSLLPENLEFRASEDYIYENGAAHDSEQEYLKALSVVCRTDILYVWEREGCPDALPFEKMNLNLSDFSARYAASAADSAQKNKLEEIKKAADITLGAVITKDGRVCAAPFFTSSDADMLVREPGDGVGFSLNYAWILAQQGKDFYEILKYFFGDIKIVLYE